MEPEKPLFIILPDSVTYSEVHGYLGEFGQVSNFNDVISLTNPYIVYGNVRKIYTPVRRINGIFSCSILMEQANHPSVPKEEFRIVLQLKSPNPLSRLKVGSFLAVFNPQPFIGGMKCFSSGPEGVIVWYSKVPVPLSKVPQVKNVNQLDAPSSVASSMKTFGVRSIKKATTFNRPIFLSQPVASTSFAHQSGEDRFNMPPPKYWIDMRRKQKDLGPSNGHSTPLKTSPLSRDGCRSNNSSLKRSTSDHSKCSHHSSCCHTHCCQSNRTVHHCCLPRENQGCCSASWQPSVSCCCHKEPPKCHGSSHHSCGCRVHSSCHQPVTGPCGGSCRHHSHSSNSSNCCVRSHCGFNNKVTSDGHCHNKKSEKTPSEPPEDGQWFVKDWVEQSTTRLGGKKSHVPEEQYLESQILTNRATYGISEVDGAMSDDDNFTSISQVLPVADPAPRPSSLLSLKRTKNVDSSSDSDSSLSDTSTLFFKRKISCPAKKPSVLVEKALNTVNDSSDQDGSLVSVDKIEDRQGVKVDPVVDKLPISSLEQNYEKGPTQIDPVPDVQDCLESDDNSNHTRKTCSELCPTPTFSPSLFKRPGCKSPSGSDVIPDKCKKKRKLYNSSDNSWYFDSARRYSDVHKHSEKSGQSNKEPAKVDEPKNEKESVEVIINLEEDDEGNVGVAVEGSQDSVGIIPPSDAETESKINGREKNKKVNPNFRSGESSEGNSKITSESELPSNKLVGGIIEEWGSGEISSGSPGQSEKIVDNLLKGLEDNDSVFAIVTLESSTKECIADGGEKPAVSQVHLQLDSEPSTSDGVERKDLENNAAVCRVVTSESSSKECIAESGEKTIVSQVNPQLDREPPSSVDASCIVDQPLTKCSSEQHRNSSNSRNTASLNSQFSIDDSIFTNETLMEAEMSQTLCEPPVLSSNVEAGVGSSNRMSLTLVNINAETPTKRSEIENPTELPELHKSSSVNPSENPTELSELHKSSSVNPSNAAESNTCDRNRVSETENSSSDVGPIIVQVPVTVHAAQRSSSHSASEDFRLLSPDSTTDRLSEELWQEEQPGKNSPASTVFYDAESDDVNPLVENRPEVGERSANPNQLDGNAGDPGEYSMHLETSNNDDVAGRALIPNQIFGVFGAIVDIAPHINESTMGSIVEAVCRSGCKSRFDLDAVIGCPKTSKACKLCATRSHHSCPSCQESGSLKPLCLEFKFELHVLIGEKILRLEVAQREAVKFLGIGAKEFIRKGHHAMVTLKQLEGLCCANPQQKVHRLSGQLYIKTEQRNNKIVPLLVRTRLKEFKMSEKPL